MSGNIDVNINVSERPEVSVDRLNKVLDGIPVRIRELDTSETEDPTDDEEFRAKGSITGRPDDLDLPPEFTALGRMVAELHDNSRCRVEQTDLDSRISRREFTIRGYIQP